jgi:GTP-sensing pleiotropic transcriptional regulator CodY
MPFAGRAVHAGAFKSAAALAINSLSNSGSFASTHVHIGKLDTFDQFTQEFLAEMLGVKRTSVTLHARTLQQAGMIKYSRGHIQIIDVEALQETVCECYDTVKSYYQALLGPQSA